LDTASPLTAAELRWPSPLVLWTGILAGPLAWGADLFVSYALVKWTCLHQRQSSLAWVTLGALTIAAAAGALSWRSVRCTGDVGPDDGADPRQRAHFMALLGVASSALSGVSIAALDLPRWMLDACR
jgi:hypothetical protein